MVNDNPPYQSTPRSLPLLSLRIFAFGLLACLPWAVSIIIPRLDLATAFYPLLIGTTNVLTYTLGDFP